MESRYACVEYLAKCASNSKTEKISSVGQEAFFQVMNYVSEATAPENSIRKLMLQCEGERDMQQEIMQQILGLQFYCSSFQVVKFFLDSSKDVLYQVTTLRSGISGFKFSGIFEKL